jgi:ElaB/YqjD/DUF883 family membrane-anchored ribosome-binding protein
MSSEVTPNKLVEDLGTLVADAEALLRATTGDASEAARERIRETLASAKVQLAEAEAALVDQTREAARAADEYVQRHPWQAVGMGALAGLVLGLLIGRR